MPQTAPKQEARPINWKQEAIEKLRSYPLRRGSLARLDEELQRIEHELQRLRAAAPEADTARKPGPPDRGDEALVNHLVLREELRHARHSAALWVGQVEQALTHLDEDGRRILEQLFFDGTPGSVDRLCDTLCMERSTLYRRRDRALRQFTLALYGALEQ